MRPTSVRTARDGHLALVDVLLLDEVLGGVLEVVKDVLLPLLGSCEMPRLAVLGSAANVGDAVEVSAELARSFLAEPLGRKHAREYTLIVLDPSEE